MRRGEDRGIYWYESEKLCEGPWDFSADTAYSHSGCLEGVLLLFHAAFALQMFFLFVELLALFGVLFYDYGRKRQFYAHMEGQMETLKEKYLLMEMLEEPEFLEGKIFCQVMQEMEKSMNDEIFGQIRRNNEFKRYVETWVHEVKLPIASIRLMLHEHRSEVSRALKEQVSRIESDVEQVLYHYAARCRKKIISYKSIR